MNSLIFLKEQSRLALKLIFISCLFFFVAPSGIPLMAQGIGVEEGQSDSPDLLEKRHGKTNVSIKLKDDYWNKVRIESAALDGQDIHIKKNANVFGVRATLNTKLSSGEHTLRWTVSKPSRKGRVTLSFRKTFNVSPREGNVTIVVTGQKATIS